MEKRDIEVGSGHPRDRATRVATGSVPPRWDVAGLVASTAGLGRRVLGSEHSPGARNRALARRGTGPPAVDMPAVDRGRAPWGAVPGGTNSAGSGQTRTGPSGTATGRDSQIGRSRLAAAPEPPTCQSHGQPMPPTVQAQGCLTHVGSTRSEPGVVESGSVEWPDAVRFSQAAPPAGVPGPRRTVGRWGHSGQTQVME